MDLLTSYTQAQEEYLAIVVRYPRLIDACNIKEEYFSSKLFQLTFRHIKTKKQLDQSSFLQEMIKLNLIQEASDMLVMFASLGDVVNPSGMITLRANQILSGYKEIQVQKIENDYKNEIITVDEYLHQLIEVKKITIEAKKEKLNGKKIRERIKNKQKGVLLKNHNILTHAMKLTKGDVVTIAAPSGFGKSAFALNMFDAFGTEIDSMLQYYNLEISQDTIDARMLAINSRGHGNYKVDDFNQDNVDTEWAMKCFDRLEQVNGFVETGSITLERLKASILANLEEDKLNVVFIDHVGLISVENEKIGQDDYQRITHVMKELRKLALDNDLILFIVSQLDRASLKNKAISMHSLKGSGEIENSSTHVLLLVPWKDEENIEEENKTHKERLNIVLAKNRNGDKENLTYDFYKETQVFYEIM